MPWTQQFIHPDTGATFPASYLRVYFTAANHPSNQLHITVARYASVTTYSLGRAPIQFLDFDITGSQYVSQFAPVIGSALGSLNIQFQAVADAVIPVLATGSGFIISP